VSFLSELRFAPKEVSICLRFFRFARRTGRMCDMCVGKTSWCISLAQSIAYLSALKVDDLNESFPLRRCWCSTIHQYLHTGAEGRGFSIMCPGVPVSRCPGGPCSWLSASHLRTEGGGRFSVCLLAPSKWQQNVAISLRGFLYSQLSGSLDFLPACLQSLQGGVCSRGQGALWSC